MSTKKKVVQKKKPKQLALPSPIGCQTALAPAQSIDLDPQLLIMTAVQSGASMDVLERLMNMRDRLKREQAEVAFRESMAALQADCPVIKKSREVRDKSGKVRYKYSTLDDIVRVVKPIISKHGFSYRTETNFIKDPSAIEAVVVVTHAMGHSERSTFTVPVTASEYMSEPQTFGVAQTFAQRYAFRNAFGILTGDEDTDGRPVTISEPESQAKIAEIEEKMNVMPDNVKNGFRTLGYTMKNVVMFCERFGWDYPKIFFEISQIIKAKGITK